MRVYAGPSFGIACSHVYPGGKRFLHLGWRGCFEHITEAQPLRRRTGSDRAGEEMRTCPLLLKEGCLRR